MTNEERLRKYKDIPSPTKTARSETVKELIESMKRVGIPQDMIQRTLEDWTRREYGYSGAPEDSEPRDSFEILADLAMYDSEQDDG